MKDIFGIFIGIKNYLINYLINSIISSIFGRLFLNFKDLVNEGQILNFYKNFIHKNIDICKYLIFIFIPGFV